MGAKMSESTAGSREISPDIPLSGASRTRKLLLSAPIAIILLAAALRLFFIGRFQVWLDEAYCFAVAKKTIGRIIADLAYDNGPPLYYICLHYWMLIFGDSPLALRSLSALFSTGAVAVIAFWDAPWFPRTARLLAAFALAITPVAIYYGQEARMYSPVVFFVLLSMVFLEKGLRLGGLRNWALFSLCTALGLYTSYIAIFLVPVGYIVLLMKCLSSKRSVVFRRFLSLLAAHVAAAALFLPWLPVFLKQPSDKAVQWIGPVWENSDKLGLPLKSLTIMTTGGAYYPVYLRNLYQGPDRTQVTRDAIDSGRTVGKFAALLSSIPASLPYSFMIITTLALFAAAFSRRSDFPARIFLASWVLLSFLVPLSLSFIRPVFILGRYEITGVPAVAILTGIGLSRLRASARGVAVGLLCALFLYSYGYMFDWPAAAPLVEGGAKLAAVASKGDVVLCEGFDYAQMYYHVGGKRDDLAFVSIPRDVLLHAAWIDYDKYLQPGWEIPRAILWEEAELALAEAAAKTPPGHALIILRPTGSVPSWLAAIDQTLRPAVEAAVNSGAFQPDMALSNPQEGIIVLRRQ